MKNNYYDNYYFNKFEKTNLIYKWFIPMVDRKEPVLSFLKNKKNKGNKLLDLGCGNGRFLSYAQKYFDCTGVDFSKKAIAQAKKKASKAKYILGSVENLNFKPNSFDIVTAFDIIEHIKNYEKMLIGAKKILKKEGLLIISAPNPESLGAKIKGKKWYGYQDPSHLRFFKISKWQQILKKYGFKTEKIYYNGLIDPPYINWLSNFVQKIFIKYTTQTWSLLGLPLPKQMGEIFFIVLKK
jgi:ubiquinone/menaquinone biosynthesis C-methylase UbiE